MTKKVLIIDDDDFIRELLCKIVVKCGYQPVMATGGNEGLTLAQEVLPDCILLDMMMPNMDGREVCERLKNIEATQDIPVIFVTAKTEIDDQVQGLKIGAHDYICKPIQPKELSARLDAALRVKELQDQLKDKLRLQQELEQAHQHMIEQYMSAMFGQLAESLVHELNNPLAAVIGFAELIKRRNLISDEQVMGHIEMIRSMGARASAKLSSLLCIAKTDGNKAYVNFNTIVSDVVELINARLLTVQVTIEMTLQEDLPEIRGSANQLARAVLALINNAVDAAEKLPDYSRRKIDVATRLLPSDEIKFTVCNSGEPITEQVASHLFEPFFTTKGAEHTGLGLFMVKSIMDAHDGQVRWECGPDMTCFNLILPVKS